MRTGELRQPGQIQQKTVTGTGDRGQPQISWSILCSPWMGLKGLHGKQLEIARQLVATATHRVHLRYRTGVVAGMKVFYDGRTFAIGWVDDSDPKRHDMYLLVTEQTTGAT